MSVYTKVSHSTLNKKPQKKIYLMVCSQNSILTTKYFEPTKKPYWMADILCSIKEKRLYFHIYQQNSTHEQNQLLVGSAVLKFSAFAHLISVQESYKPTLKLSKDGAIVGQIYLFINFNHDKKYIGDLQYGEDTQIYNSKKSFYYSKANLKTEVSLNEPKTRQQIYEESQFRSTQFIPKKRENYQGKVTFYKGPCQTINLFSCCDKAVEGQQFQIIERIYRDKK